MQVEVATFLERPEGSFFVVGKGASYEVFCWQHVPAGKKADRVKDPSGLGATCDHLGCEESA